MWFLLLFPAAWILSEVFKMDRPIRMAIGITSLIAIAWLTSDKSTELAYTRERVHYMTQQSAMHSIEEALRAGDTNRVLTALIAYHNTARTTGVIHAATELSRRLKTVP